MDAQDRRRTFIGRAGLRHVELEGVLELELAYTFVRSAWGQGFATEIARTLVEIWETRCSGPKSCRHRHEGQPVFRAGSLKAGFAHERDAVFHD